MTKKQRVIVEKYVEQLEELKYRYSDDKEVLHIEADEALVSALIDLGFEEIVEAYCKCKEVGFWYS